MRQQRRARSVRRWWEVWKPRGAALLAAVDHGAIEDVQRLLDKGADLGAASAAGESPLHRAILRRDEAIIELLLNNGAKVDASDVSGKQPIHMAALSGSVAAVRALHQHGAKLSDPTSDGGWTPLHYAAALGHRGAADELLELGADLTARNSKGLTPLHCTATDDLPESLLEAARPARGTASTWAPSEEMDAEKRAIAALLLDRGADLEARDQDGRSPLHLAVAEGKLPLVQLLIERGATIDAKDSSGKTPLTGIPLKPNPRMVPMLNLLLDRGAAVDSADDEGDTALHLAAAVELVEVIELLLARGASVNRRNKKGLTPLHFAATFAETGSAVEALVSNGAEIDAPAPDGATPLYLACEELKPRVVELLLRRGANPDAKRTLAGGYGVVDASLAARLAGRIKGRTAEGDQIGQLVREWPQRAGDARSETCKLEKGPSIDRLIRSGKFGFDRGAGLLIRPIPDRPISPRIQVSGKVRCHGCGSELPFATQVIFPLGLGGGGKAACRSCGSVISFSHHSHELGGVRCQILIATPHVEPASGASTEIRFDVVSVEEVTD